MFVQWCVKGVGGIDDQKMRKMLFREEILCNWWRDVGRIQPKERRQKLTAANLDLHVNNYDTMMPDWSPYSKGTPFISLAAGCVSRDVLLRTNVMHPARLTATWFATDDGSREGYLFFCWVIVGLKPAPEIEGVAEEVREINTYRRYSDYQTEGEITAKIQVHANQIERVEHIDASGNLLRTAKNRRFSPPESVSNLRELF